MLAALGLYAAMAHSVERRRREFGIRMALGANRADVVRMVLGRGLRLSMSGLAVGVMAALLLSRTLRGFLYGVDSRDPATFMMVAVVLVLVSLAASLLPARRATAADPIIVLKTD
jgi:putative ABC transport system permease protein